MRVHRLVWSLGYSREKTAPLIESRLSREKITDSRIIPYKSWNSRFYCYFLCKMSGFPDLFYTNLTWLVFFFFFFLIWNSPLTTEAIDPRHLMLDYATLAVHILAVVIGIDVDCHVWLMYSVLGTLMIKPACHVVQQLTLFSHIISKWRVELQKRLHTECPRMKLSKFWRHIAQKVRRIWQYPFVE